MDVLGSSFDMVAIVVLSDFATSLESVVTLVNGQNTVSTARLTPKGGTAERDVITNYSSTWSPKQQLGHFFFSFPPL